MYATTHSMKKNWFNLIIFVKALHLAESRSVESQVLRSSLYLRKMSLTALKASTILEVREKLRFILPSVTDKLMEIP